MLLDRTDDADEPLYVFADPEGHPFCTSSPEGAAHGHAHPGPTPYDVPLGDGAGSYAFRLLPTDEFDGGESRVSVDLAAAGRAVIVAYTWGHPVDGPQAGTLLLGVPDEDGAVSAAWVDSWHQRSVVALTGTRTAAGAEVAYEYAPGWTWRSRSWSRRVPWRWSCATRSPGTRRPRRALRGHARALVLTSRQAERHGLLPQLLADPRVGGVLDQVPGLGPLGRGRRSRPCPAR